MFWNLQWEAWCDRIIPKRSTDKLTEQWDLLRRVENYGVDVSQGLSDWLISLPYADWQTSDWFETYSATL